ncbi:MAG: hypothetical protein U0326_35920 [Polyangiales bacterium]
MKPTARRAVRTFAWIVSSALVVTGCSGTALDAARPATDAARDVAPDAALDVALDVAPDTSIDVAADTRIDVAADTAIDVAADTSIDVAADASIDVAPDAADVSSPTDVAPPDLPAPVDATPDPDAPPGPIDGTWRVTEIACNGMSASGAARAYITPPNSSSFVVRGDRSTYTLSTSTCVMRLESSVTYPADGRATFTAMGPFTCTPALCGAGCGTTPRIPYQYAYMRRGAGLVMTTVGDTPDVTCTAYGQANPITYTYEAL